MLGWADRLARQLLPVVSIVSAFLLMQLPWRWPNFAIISPDLAFLTVFFWLLRRPSALPPYALFILGISIDLAKAAPLGLSAAIFLLTRTLIIAQHRLLLGVGWRWNWVVFTILIWVVFMVRWLVACLFNLTFLPFSPIVFASLLSSAAYPLIIPLLLRLEQSYKI
jgi:rod shape-determining protein MreD